METTQLEAIVEALIFAAEEPIGAAALSGLLEKEGISRKEIEQALHDLTQRYETDPARGFFLREIGGGHQFVTKPAFKDWVAQLEIAKPRTLSQAALETMAIIAYRQPLVRAEIEQIRGVDSGGVLKTLLERGLIKIVGRREEAGQPLIYGTTPAFMELFHLSSLEELPSMKEIEQMVEASHRSQEAPAGLESEAVAAEEGSESTEETAETSEPSPLETTAPEDAQALADLEEKMKGLSRLERQIFPKEKTQEMESNPAPTEGEKEHS